MCDHHEVVRDIWKLDIRVQWNAVMVEKGVNPTIGGSATIVRALAPVKPSTMTIADLSSLP